MNHLDLDDFKPTSDLSRASTLPARWYTEPQFLELGKEKIFWKTWQLVGRVDMVARPGDFFTCDLYGEPLLVTRGIDQQLRAFYNVCPHRAGPVAVGNSTHPFAPCAPAITCRAATGATSAPKRSPRPSTTGFSPT